MQSMRNGNVTYLALQRLVEKAWDEGDIPRLLYLSEAVDRHMLACIQAEYAQEKAV